MSRSSFLRLLPVFTVTLACGSAERAPVATPDPRPEKAPARAEQRAVDEEPAESAPAFPAGDAKSLGIREQALERLVTRAREANSDALVIIKDGKLVGEWYFGKERGAIEMMSATKSIVSLAIGKLIDEGKLESVEQPVHTLYPEWRQGKKQKVTIRHLLTHTSGLQNVPWAPKEIYPSPDFVQLALAAELSHAPGEKFSYNNKAINLLAGIVEQASGKRMDRYIAEAIFTPMGISDYDWDLDDAGNPHGMSGLDLNALDIAKIGQMMLDGGMWQGKRIVSKAWIDASLEQSVDGVESAGLLWWRRPAWTKIVIDEETLKKWRKGGVSKEFLNKTKPLHHKEFTSKKDFFEALAQTLGGKEGMNQWHETLGDELPRGKWTKGPVVAFEAEGFLGQYLTIVPGRRLVAVRQLRSPDKADAAGEVDSMLDFTDLVLALVPAEGVATEPSD